MTLLELFVAVAVAVIVFGFLFWLLNQFELPPPVKKGAVIVLAVFGVLFLLSTLLSLVGWAPFPIRLR